MPGFGTWSKFIIFMVKTFAVYLPQNSVLKLERTFENKKRTFKNRKRTFKNRKSMFENRKRMFENRKWTF